VVCLRASGVDHSYQTVFYIIIIHIKLQNMDLSLRTKGVSKIMQIQTP